MKVMKNEIIKILMISKKETYDNLCKAEIDLSYFYDNQKTEQYGFTGTMLVNNVMTYSEADKLIDKCIEWVEKQ